MRFTLRLFGFEIVSLDVEELVDAVVELDSDTEIDDDNEDESLPYGFAPPVTA